MFVHLSQVSMVFPSYVEKYFCYFLSHLWTFILSSCPCKKKNAKKKKAFTYYDLLSNGYGGEWGFTPVYE